MSRRLPSLNALRAFESAGRNLSFTRAAEELFVTPAAVSQLVKGLEENLDSQLLVRQGRGLALTAQGHALLPGLTELFYRLTEIVEEFRRRDAERPVTVAVPPSFGAAWLLPRLSRFRELHPEVEVRIDATYRPIDLLHEDVDIAFVYGQESDNPGMRTEQLLDEEVFPVGSPALLEGDHPVLEPDDLRHHELLHVDGGEVSADYWPDWPMWLESAGATAVDGRRGLRFNDTTMALQLAARGRGVALGSRVLASDYLATGALVRLLAHAFQVTYSYHVCCPEAIAEEPRIAAFREWLAWEAQGE